MGKNIVICSDGTGNKGGYGADTNVFKLYKAIDIHNSKTQISFYDDGVGTNSNKFIRAVTGAFGFGFARNIRQLYAFLARNYDADDHDKIYLFGFSRGAATVRAFAGMIQECGLIDTDGTRCSPNGVFDEQEFQKLICEAFAAYQNRKSHPNAVAAFKNDFGVEVKQENGEASKAVPIEMIGVWDTVSALGFPQDWSSVFDVAFRWLGKIVDKVSPHQFYNYQLNQNVEHVYHALAIDDERKTFHPKVWTETRSDKPKNIEQVWFSGAHSNVGGGYPRAGVSLVAYDWMLRRAVHHGLHFKNDTLKFAKAEANVYGKLYDSRDGLAVYYRYAPRIIDELCEGRLNGAVNIHRTVIDRMQGRTLGYAPGFLPKSFAVVDSALPAISQPVNWTFDRAEIEKWVNGRKRLYRIFAETTLVAVLGLFGFWAYPPASPELIDRVNLPSLFSSENWVSFLGGLFAIWTWLSMHFADFLHYVLPEFMEPFVTYMFRERPELFLIIITVVGLLFWHRSNLREKTQKACEMMREELLNNSTIKSLYPNTKGEEK